MALKSGNDKPAVLQRATWSHQLQCHGNGYHAVLHLGLLHGAQRRGHSAASIYLRVKLSPGFANSAGLFQLLLRVRTSGRQLGREGRIQIHDGDRSRTNVHRRAPICSRSLSRHLFFLPHGRSRFGCGRYPPAGRGKSLRHHSRASRNSVESSEPHPGIQYPWRHGLRRISAAHLSSARLQRCRTQSNFRERPSRPTARIRRPVSSFPSLRLRAPHYILALAIALYRFPRLEVTQDFRPAGLDVEKR